ncbi:MAG: NERD domain-containing protein [Acetobacterium sp.]|nr:NERD domain-containing protein [Acetobacterium sp.]
MSLFTPNMTPIFLKEDSDNTQHIARLKELQDLATGKVKDDIAREITLASYGEVGEQNIAFELKNSGIPMVVIHDLRLEFEDLSAQIDYVVVTRKMIFLIECKNLYGNIEIDNQGNFVRSYAWNGRTVKEGIYSPITQNQRHFEIMKQLYRASRKNSLSKVFSDKVFDDLYRSIVVLANPKTILNAKYAQKEVKEQVIRADQLIAHIKNQNKQSKELASSEKMMRECAERILALHKHNQTDYTKKYETILSGLTPASPAPPRPSTAAATGQAKPADRESAAKPYTVTTAPNNELVAKLKAYRLETSRSEKVQAYVVFNDRQLEDLISQKPKTIEELRLISGFGPVKAEKYGPGILTVLSPLEGVQAAATKASQNQSWSPSQLVGEKITHQSFGSGTVKSVSRHEIIIKFPMTARSFAFPDVFDTTIWLSNPALQQKVEVLIKAKKS